MKKLKLCLTRTERAFIFFAIQSYTAQHLRTYETEGLRICYLGTLFKVYRKEWQLWNAEDLVLPFTLAEIGSVHQLVNELFDKLQTSEHKSTARGIIWKTHPIVIKNENILRNE